MAKTLTQMASQVHLNVANHSHITLAQIQDLVNTVYQEMGNDFEWSMRERETYIATVAPYTTGTLTATLDSATVTGSGTTWTSAMVGRNISILGMDAPFFVGTFVSTMSITLGDPQGNAVTWPTTTASGLTYSIFKSQYALPSDVDKIIWDMISEYRLAQRPMTYLNAADPYRTSRGTPTVAALARTTSVSGTETRFIELLPVPSAGRTVRIPYLAAINDLAAGDSPLMPADPIINEATARACHFMAAKTGDLKWFQIADRYSKAAADTMEGNKSDDEGKVSMPDGFIIGGSTRSYDQYIRSDPGGV